MGTIVQLVRLDLFYDISAFITSLTGITVTTNYLTCRCTLPKSFLLARWLVFKRKIML
ncbi:MAG: hypothetical protein ACQEW2_08495 [Bacillota bacterium]|uniref:hypothetical protein n=1 Tax=Cytobacillus firmus TaxID=1399 RepID=UPI0012E717D3|nr:hypothetical protein [Cytobacillus firmus]MEC1892908.1 hypothetical protein [Cytobacillus firmus]MED4450112.1 hypothetical protein [Cytobacillus firmus]MED4766420.1 hypothetical protein [Cytobacillus firmus]